MNKKILPKYTHTLKIYKKIHTHECNKITMSKKKNNKIKYKNNGNYTENKNNKLSSNN